MPVKVTDFISTTDPSDTYATHDAVLGKGGQRTVGTLVERDAIPVERREEGMLVYVKEDGLTYYLGSDMLSWDEFVPDIGGIGVNSIEFTADRKIVVTDANSNTVTTIGQVWDKVDRVLRVGKTGAQYSTVQSAVTASTFGNLISIAPGGYTEAVTITQANTVLYGEGGVNDSYGVAVNGVLTCTSINRLRMKDLQWQGIVNITGGTAHKLLNCAFQNDFNLTNIVNWSEITDCSFTKAITINASNTGTITLIRPSFQSNGTIINNSSVPVYVVDCIKRPTVPFTGNVIIIGQYYDQYYSPTTYSDTISTITDEKIVVIDNDGKLRSMEASDAIPDTTYTNLSPTPTTLGGVPAGTTFNNVTVQTVFDMLFYPYQYPAFGSFSVSGLSDTEVGFNFTADTRTFSWTTTNGSNITPNTIDIIDVTNSNTLLDNGANTSPVSLAVPDLVKNTATSHTFRIEATNTQSGVFTRNFTINWRWAVFYGESASASLTGSDINALRVKTLASNSNGTYNMLGGDYKYICYPTSMGLKTTFKDASTNLDVAMDAVQTVSVTNNYGVVTNYYVHRTLNTLGGAITIIVS